MVYPNRRIMSDSLHFNTVKITERLKVTIIPKTLESDKESAEAQHRHRHIQQILMHVLLVRLRLYYNYRQ